MVIMPEAGSAGTHRREIALFERRREAFMTAMGSGVAILPTHPEVHRTADQDFAFRPNSDFYYLTGFKEPGSVLVLAPQHPEHRVILFVRPRDPLMETWNGRRAGIEGAKQRYGADAAYPIDELEAVLPRYLDNQSTVYYRLGSHTDERVLGVIASYRTKARSGVTGPDTLADPGTILHEMRLVKGPEEADLMRRSAAIAAAAHVEAMKATWPGRYEYEIQAEIEYVFRKQGAMGPAYGSIVGGGANGCILHYGENDAVLKDGDLLLIDAGAEYDFYASDITRTFPVNGRFSPVQRAVYEVVLASQLAAIELCRPGVRFGEVHERALEVLTEGLVHLGLLQGAVPDLVRQEAYRPFYMHRTSHWLGLDTHDVGRYKVEGKWRVLEPGMVLTVEPGLYLASGTPGVDARYADIGIRIEDDVLITETGHEVLTSGVPKTVEAIEALMQGASALAEAR